jgi:uncharacterized membrane protein YqjE
MSRSATGLLGDARSIAATGVRAVRTRLELLEIEIATAKSRLVRAAVVAAAAFYLLSFGTLLAILWAAEALPPEWRLPALGGLAVALLVAGTAAIFWLARTQAAAPPVLSTLVAVLKRDEDALEGGSS